MQYLIIFFVLLLSLFLVFISLLLSKYVQINKVVSNKNLPYECGEHTIGSSWIKFNAGFYVFGMVFLLFDVETIFILPWVIILRDVKLLGFIEIFVFFLILILGFLYALKKGAFEWKA